MYRNEQIQRALMLPLKSLDTKLEEFMGNVPPFTVDFAQSNFYVVGRSEEFCEKLLADLLLAEKVDPANYYMVRFISSNVTRSHSLADVPRQASGSGCATGA